MRYDVLIVGGGPGGLSAALALGRARKRVLVCDGGPRRNALAVHLQNFVTRDGTAPTEFRRMGREELARYTSVEVRDAKVDAIAGSRGAFSVTVDGAVVEARRILLCTGMVDEMLPIEGFREHWGHSIYQCPYCHGWEVQDRRWGYLVNPQYAAHAAPFALQALGWSRDLVTFTNGAPVPPEAIAQLRAAGIVVETAPIAALVGEGGKLAEVVLSDGRRVARDVLYAHPPQRQVALVTALGIGLDDDGYVKVDPMRRETTVPGIFAAGDLMTRMQSAINASANASIAAAMINLELAMESAPTGA